MSRYHAALRGTLPQRHAPETLRASDRPCAATDCPCIPLGRRVFCDACWALVPEEYRRPLVKHAGELFLKGYVIWIRHAIRWIVDQRDPYVARLA